MAAQVQCYWSLMGIFGDGTDAIQWSQEAQVQHYWSLMALLVVNGYAIQRSQEVQVQHYWPLMGIWQLKFSVTGR